MAYFSEQNKRLVIRKSLSFLRDKEVRTEFPNSPNKFFHKYCLE